MLTFMNSFGKIRILTKKTLNLFQAKNKSNLICVLLMFEIIEIVIKSVHK